ncbi:MAG: tetratricopeptide repeat protein, partial [Chloroflexota bacterium]
GRPEVGAAILGQAIRLEPQNAIFHTDIGKAHFEMHRMDAAKASFSRAVELNPSLAEAQCSLGCVLHLQGDLSEAIACYQRALELRPEYAEVLINLSLAYSDQDKFQESEALTRRALAMAPDLPEAHFNLASTLLLRGDFESGFAEYEWRLRCSGFSQMFPRFSQPMWDGHSVEGSRLLLVAEQGFGDTIQMIRYAPRIADRGIRVVVQCQPELKELLLNVAGIDEVFSREEALPDFDQQALMMSLPHHFGTTIETIPISIPYVHIHSDRSAKVAHELSPHGKPRIGLVWSGNPDHPKNSQRSLTLTDLAPLLQVPEIEFFSLQKGPASRDATKAPHGTSIRDLSPLLSDFADTAAVIANLDLVITVDTAVAHLAGALGQPVWLLLSYAADWRWLTNRQDSPWYPSMHLFRQGSPGDWKPVIESVIARLRAHRANGDNWNAVVSSP